MWIVSPKSGEVGCELERFPNGTELRTISTSPATPRGLQGGFPVSVKSSTRQVDGVTIVDLSGRITLGEGSVTLKDTVHDLLSKGLKRILLNLGEVNYVDSSGIGALVSALTAAKNQGGELKLLNVTKRVHDLLQITKLHSLFDVKNDEAAAVQSFAK
jgi:anti-sigma B factor antagonist